MLQATFIQSLYSCHGAVCTSLDGMAQDQATHHKTIETKNQVYGRSERNHGKFVGRTIGVAQNWPIDCYNQTFWNGLGKYPQDIISTVLPINIQQIAKNMGNMCGKTTPAAPSGLGDQGTSGCGHKRPKGKRRRMAKGLWEQYKMGLWWLISLTHFWYLVFPLLLLTPGERRGHSLGSAIA